MLFLYLMTADSSKEIAKTSPKNLVCESCGESFSCGSNLDKCWCFEIDLTDKTLENLKSDYNNCLCNNCLKNYGEKEK